MPHANWDQIEQFLGNWNIQTSLNQSILLQNGIYKHLDSTLASRDDP